MKGHPLKPQFERKNRGISIWCSVILLIAAAGCANRDAPPPSPLNSAPSGANTNRPIASGATTSPAAPVRNPGDDVIATVGNTVITRRQLEKPLIEAYGLDMLAKIAQLEVAKQGAKQRSITVTPNDIQAETERYLATLFDESRDRDLRQLNEELVKAEVAKDKVRAEQIRNDIRRERNMLLDQLLQQQKVSRVDFAIVMETNTYLRAIAESELKAQGPPSEEAVRQTFNHLYGEKAVVRDIQVADLKEATEVKRRLAQGDPFEMVAREMSRNPQAAALGGELQPFSRDTPDFPQTFKDVAFGLKVGEVSDAVLIGDAYHIMRLESRIAPKVIKFEDVKEGVRDFLVARQIEVTVQGLRSGLQRDVVTSLTINEPVLKQQYDAQRTRSEETLQEKGDMRRELDRRIQQERADRPANTPTTAPATPGDVAPATKPSAAPSTAPSASPTTR
ncbi:hypothetical protein BH09PLA1_BH09PLA1_15650 [soil metagenome]